MSGSTTAAKSHGKARTYGAAPSSLASSSKRTQAAAAAAAVSATKKRASTNRGNRRRDETVSASVSPFGELCIALYRPKKLRKESRPETNNNDNDNDNDNNNTESTRGIWWPALRFPSIADFQKAMEANLLREGFGSKGCSNNNNGRKSLEWSSHRKKRKQRKKLVQKVMKEALREIPIETLVYLGRPLEDYVTADDAVKIGVEVQDFTQGLVLLTQQAKRPWFPRLFLSEHRSSENENKNEAIELFRDFYVAMDETMARHNECEDSDSDDSDSDSDDSVDEEGSAGSRPQNLRSWTGMAQKIWDNYHNTSDQHHHHHSNASSMETEASPKPLIAPAAPEAKDHEFEDDEEDLPQHPPHDDASIAQSAAAVSYTEASLMSASRGGGGTVAPTAVSPPDLSDEVIREGDDVETIWHKHQMEGWDRYLLEDVADGSETMVYEAPNGFKFDSEKAFCDYLTETYGFCGSDHPNMEALVSPQKQSKKPNSTKPRGRTAKARNADAEHRSSSRSRSGSRSRSRSRSRDNHEGLEWSELWLYLTNTLQWTYNYATNHDMKIYGMNTTALWFRPGFDIKHRGELGRDYFISEDSVLRYCLKQNIRPPPRDNEPKTSEADEENQKGQPSQPEELEREDDSEPVETIMEDDSSTDDTGYATPDDQSTVPQDPGKPRLPSPKTTSSGASGRSGGSYYSYDNDPDRYVFPNLWQRLKNKGWSWCKARNSLEDYWYIRPASIRSECDWIRGIDYFGTEEDVINFCKERDLMSMKEREKRRNELLQRARETTSDGHNTGEREEQSREEAKVKQPTIKKKKGRGRQEKESSNKNQIKPNATNKRRNSIDEGESGAKSSKKQKAIVDKRKSRVKAPREGFSCEDKNLKANAKVTPWARNMPIYEHKMCLNATGLNWSGLFYYLPGEIQNSYTVRFQNLGDVARYFALNANAVVWRSGGTEPSNEDERSFERLIRYALVPGLQSAWAQIRKITRSETSFLLRKLGYKSQGSSHDTSWEPPEALVGMGHLEQRYASLESLCEALRCLGGDLQTPPSARRRKQELNITPTQLMALRLRMAEGFSGLEEDEEEKPADSVAKEEASVKKRKRAIIRDESHKESAVTSTEVTNNEAEVEVEEQFFLSPSEQKIKDFAEDEEKQIAMSPSKIKVGKFRKNPEDNTAPWAVNPPKVPKGGWTKMYYKMGVTYHSGYYYLPGESFRNYTKQFSKVDDIRHHICVEGQYSQYLDELGSKEQTFVKRHFNYGNVPGNPYEWRKLRQLDLQETVLFLNLLGFEKGPGKYGWWQIPAGVPILEAQSYPTFSELCKALVRIPDLEDRTLGMSNRRRSRKKDEDMVLSDYQMMALRLGIAEGFEEEDERVVEKKLKQIEKDKKHDEDNKLLFEHTNELVDQLRHDTRNHTDAWKALQNLGCTYNGRYRVPGHGIAVGCQNELVELILEHSVDVLEWGHCTLNTADIRYLERYLKAFHARGSDFQLVQEVLPMVTKANIRNYLKQLDINERNDKYYVDFDEYSESEMVNMIRSTKELNRLCKKESTSAKRCHSGDDQILSKLEILSLRLWAFFSDVPLTNMPEPSMIGQAVKSGYHEGKETETCSIIEGENRRKIDYNEMNHESLVALTNHSKHDKNAHSLTASEKEVLTSKPSPFHTAMSIQVSKTHDETSGVADEDIGTQCEVPEITPATNYSDMNSDAEILDDSQQHEAIEKELDTGPNTKSVDPSSEMELEDSTTATDQIVNSPSSSPSKNQAAAAKSVTESEKKPESTFDSAKTTIEMEVEEAGTSVGTSVDANPALAEAHVTNQLRSSLATESAVEITEAAIEKPCLESTNNKPETAFASTETTVQMDLEESDACVGATVDQPHDTEQATDAGPAPAECHATNLLLLPSETEIVTKIVEAVTEKPSIESANKQPESTCAPAATSVQMNSEDAVTCLGTTSVDEPHDAKEATDVNDVSPAEGHVTNPPPLSPSITKTAAEIADLMFHANGASSFALGGLTTPPPKTKCRKSNKERRRRDYSSRRTPPQEAAAEGFSEFFTPKQHNMSSRPSISIEESGRENERHESGFSEQRPVVGVAAAHALPAENIYRTATSHGEAFGESLGLMTQPDEDPDIENDACDDDENESTLDMTQSAELDFQPASPSPVFSPLEVATRRLKPSQRYGSHDADPSDDDADNHNNDVSAFFTQQDEGYNSDNDWLDKQLF
jgi:hypothetical protein